MDPLSITSGIAGIAGLFSVCVDILERVETYKDSGISSSHLSLRVKAERRRLQDWALAVGMEGETLRKNHHPKLDDEEICTIVKSILVRIGSLFATTDHLQRKLQHNSITRQHGARSNSKASSADIIETGLNLTMGAKMRWTFIHESRFTKAVERLEKLAEKLYALVPDSKQQSAHVTILYAEGSPPPYHERQSSLVEFNSNADLQSIMEESQRATRIEDLKMIDELLNSPRLQDELQIHTRTRLEGTCNWIFDKPIYNKWLSAETSSTKARFLWLYGPAGCGKTILCSHIITSLRKLYSPFVFHFFTSLHEQSGGQLEDIIRSWISQIARSDQSSLDLVNTHLKWNASGWILDSSDVWEAFGNIVSQLKRCIFILDGLDEYSRPKSNRQEFLKNLKANLKNTSCMVVLTSRDEPDIRTQLIPHGSLTDGPILYWHEITKLDTHSDIGLFAQNIVEQKLPRKNAGLRRDLASHMVEQCDGMFLWLDMIGRDLRETQSKSRLKLIVDSTPNLRTAYERNWRSILDQPEYDKVRGLRILQWCIFSHRPLSVEELTVALVVQSLEDTDEIDPDDLPDTIDDDYIESEIKQLCGSLIEVKLVDASDEPALKIVQLAHLSVKEYLWSVMFSSSQDEPILGEGHKSSAHLELAKVCLHYLGCANISESNEIGKSFCEYALKNWIVHKNISRLGDSSFDRLLIRFLDLDNPSFKKWAATFESREWNDTELPYSDDGATGPLYFAALLGFDSVLEEKLTKDTTSINMIGGVYGTALQAACAKGNEAAISILLCHGADVTIRAGKFGSALGAAAYHGQLNLVLELLKRGARINEEGRLGRTPLYSAALRGHTKIAEALLDHGADPTITDDYERTPMNVCCFHGHLEIVQLLLRKGADIDRANKDRWTPLFSSVVSCHADVVEVLLEQGANFRITSLDEWTPAHAAASTGHLQILQNLLNAGADIMTTNKDGRTPLISAANQGHLEIVMFLVKNGIDITASDNVGWTAVDVAADMGHLEVVRFLLDEGAKIDTSDKVDGWTPLLAACDSGHLETVRFLLDTGAEINKPDKTNSWAPLLASASQGYTDVVDLLINRGADINKSNNAGMTPLFAAASNGHIECVRLLLNHGADPNAEIHSGQTPVFAAVLGAYPEIVKLLDHHGSSFMSKEDPSELRKDGQGRSILHYAAKSGRVTMLDDLLKNIDVPIREDRLGRSILDYACMSGSPEMIRKVLKIYESNNLKLESSSPWSYWHWACLRGSYEALSLLAEANIKSWVVSTNFPTASWTPIDLAVYWKNEKLVSSRGILLEKYPWLSVLKAESVDTMSDTNTMNPFRLNPLGPGVETESGRSCDGCFSDLVNPYFHCRICSSFDYCFVCKHGSELAHPEHQWEFIEYDPLD